jgi:hypothetical protein
MTDQQIREYPKHQLRIHNNKDDDIRKTCPLRDYIPPRCALYIVVFAVGLGYGYWRYCVKN